MNLVNIEYNHTPLCPSCHCCCCGCCLCLPIYFLLLLGCIWGYLAGDQVVDLHVHVTSRASRETQVEGLCLYMQDTRLKSSSCLLSIKGARSNTTVPVSSSFQQQAAVPLVEIAQAVFHQAYLGLPLQSPSSVPQTFPTLILQLIYTQHTTYAYTAHI